MRMVTILSPRMAYLTTRRTKEDNEILSSVDDNSQADKQQKHTSALFLLRSALCAEAVSTPQIRWT